ncbi:MAG: helix-turn-helix transcriptional regulator [Clostridia bacterium]|nr:helix-turn-helix transcriptional regulator [Clostridia bacterium]
MIQFALDLMVNITGVYRVKWDADVHKVSPRPFAALSYRVRGDAHFTSPCELKAHSGDVLYIPANCGYDVSYSAGEIIVIHFNASGYTGSPENYTFNNKLIIKELFSKAVRIWEKGESNRKYELAACLYEILAEMHRQTRIVHSEQGYGKFESALKYLESNFCDSELNIGAVCRSSGISETYFRRRFSELYSKSPVKYLTELRLERARAYLAAKNCSVSEAAYKSGFSDVKYFSRVVKKHYGVVPSKLYEI